MNRRELLNSIAEFLGLVLLMVALFFGPDVVGLLLQTQ